MLVWIFPIVQLIRIKKKIKKEKKIKKHQIVGLYVFSYLKFLLDLENGRRTTANINNLSFIYGMAFQNYIPFSRKRYILYIKIKEYILFPLYVNNISYTILL